MADQLPELHGADSWSVAASFGQERVWIAGQLDPASPVYNLACDVTLPFAITADDVRAALRTVVGRHETLRTALRAEQGTVSQLISAEVAVQVEELDLTGLPDAQRTDRLAEICAADVREPVSLDRAPLWRARLVRMGGADWRLCFVVHHAVFDATSMRNFRAELTELCRARAEGRRAQLPSLEIQYADFAVWQRAQLAAAGPQRLDYWRTRLADLPLVHGLPTDRPRSATPSYAGGEVAFALPGVVLTRLEPMARELRTTPFAVLLAGFAALLARLGGRPDVAVGVPVAGRELAELGPLIGMFINTVVVAVHAPGELSFGALVGAVRENLLEDLEHRDVPFQLLVDAVAPERDTTVAPLYQIGFNYLPGDTIGSSHDTAREELTLEVSSTEGRLQYSTALFDRATVQDLADRYVRLLAAALADPSTLVADLPLLSDEERGHLLPGAVTDAPEPDDATVPTRFARQVARTPDDLAVIDGSGQQLTYRQLDQRAGQIATELRRAGVGRGDVVAVGVSRSTELVAALLGVWRAGAAYLPLDPEYPPARLAFVVADARAVRVLAQRTASAALAGVGAPVCWLDEIGDGPDSTTAPVCGAGPDDLAWVIYTSGSTGRPKGVAVGHRAVANQLRSFGAELGAGQQDRWLALASVSFDPSALEIFLPLTVGGSVVMADEEQVKDGAALVALADRHRVTHLQATPSHWRMLVSAGFRDPTVTGLTGGEALTPGLATDLRDRLHRLINVYGPTETTVWATSWEVPRTPDEVAVGRPIANLRAYVLDEWCAPVPVRHVGELCLGGAGVGWGYLHRAGLTAAKFVPDPYGAPGSRLYRTGDLARWRTDGELEFLGRDDGQVKLRGQRIELAEIEARLSDHPAVRRAVVLVRPDGAEGQLLVAYLTAEGVPEPDVAGLRRHLAGLLPPFMVPDVFVTVESFPLTRNGKLDQRALPEPDRGSAGDRPVVPLRTDTEKLVARAWSQVLGRDEISAADDFFEVGGNSIVAVQLIAAIRSAAGVRLPMRSPFDAPTVAEMAAVVDRLRETGGDRARSAVPIARIAGRPGDTAR